MLKVRMRRSKEFWKKIGRFARKNRGEIIYYAAVALTLCAFACAAEQMRERRIQTQQSVALPAVEIREQPEIKKEEEIRFELPKGACFMRAYAPHPEWNSENGCWQCHMGVDISFENAQVASITEGRVSAIGENGSSGGYVEIVSGKYRLRYCSVKPHEALRVGDAVAIGEVIASDAKNMPGEAYLGEHAHLEILCKETHINPEQVIENAT